MMKSLRMWVALWLTAFISLSAQAIEVGQKAPDFELPGKAGLVRLSDLKGQTVYLDFWASWCGPCRQSFPWMNEMQSRYGAKGLTVLGLNVDANLDDAQAFLAANPAKFAVAFDGKGKAPASYGIKGMPTSLLIGPDGKVLWVHTGFKAEESAALEQKIRQALGVK